MASFSANTPIHKVFSTLGPVRLAETTVACKLNPNGIVSQQDMPGRLAALAKELSTAPASEEHPQLYGADATYGVVHSTSDGPGAYYAVVKTWPGPASKKVQNLIAAKPDLPLSDFINTPEYREVLDTTNACKLAAYIASALVENRSHVASSVIDARVVPGTFPQYIANPSVVSQRCVFVPSSKDIKFSADVPDSKGDVIVHRDATIGFSIQKGTTTKRSMYFAKPEESPLFDSQKRAFTEFVGSHFCLDTGKPAHETAPQIWSYKDMTQTVGGERPLVPVAMVLPTSAK
jgi:hypothetical protein